MPTNALHSCLDVSEAQRLIAAKRAAGGDAAVRVFVNEKNDKGQAPIHALMRQGPKARAVIKYLIETPEVDINALEDSTGVSIAHLCEDGTFMRYLANQRDFNPNVVNPFTGQTPLEYGVTYPKHPDLTKALITCQRLVIDEAKMQALSARCTDPKSIESLSIINQEISRRRLGGGSPTLAPGYRTVVTTTTTVTEPMPPTPPAPPPNDNGCRIC